MITKKLSFAATIALLLFASTVWSAAPRQEVRLMTATQVLNELQSTPDQNVPQWLLERAYAVAIVPDVIKVGLGIGARRGSGVLVVRKDDGHWTSPIFINLTGGSFGLQAGVQSTDVMLVFTSRASVEGIVGGKLTLGADASAAAGPVGRQTSAATDVGFNAQIYSYSRAKGLFAGLALDGSALTIDNKSNAAYYGKPGLLASELINGTAPVPPESAQQFMGTLDRILGVAKPANSTTVAAQPSNRAPAPVGQSSEPGKLTTHPMEDPSPGTEPPR